MILRDQAQFPLARRLRGKSGASIAEVFAFLSGLYFRGKVAYANAFARPARGTSGVLVIAPARAVLWMLEREFASMICMNCGGRRPRERSTLPNPNRARC